MSSSKIALLSSVPAQLPSQAKTFQTVLHVQPLHHSALTTARPHALATKWLQPSAHTSAGPPALSGAAPSVLYQKHWGVGATSFRLSAPIAAQQRLRGGAPVIVVQVVIAVAQLARRRAVLSRGRGLRK